jgi:hypothetical protein
MENGEQGAFACVDSQKQYLQEGLTKREYFAGLALQGICMQKYVQRDNDREAIAKWSVKMADAILAELEKTKEE